MKVAVLGVGNMGRTVLKHLRECTMVKSIAGYDCDPHRTAAARQDLGIEAASDLGALLADPALRLVFVTAANDAHEELTLRALAAGKAVMCEKPMATTLEKARRMVEATKERRAFLQIGFELRYSKLFTTVKQWIDQGLLGRVLNTHCQYIASEFWGNRSWRTQRDSCGTMFGEKLSHYVDLPRWWIGQPVIEVYSACAPNVVPYFQVRDNYHTSYRFAGGAVSHLTFAMGPAASSVGDPLQNLVSQQAEDGHVLRYLVYGTAGAAETDVFHRTLKRWAFDATGNCGFKSQWVEAHSWDESEDQPYFHNTRDQTHDIVRRVANGLPPATSAQDAYQTMQVCFAAEHSAATGQVVRLGDAEVPREALCAGQRS